MWFLSKMMLTSLSIALSTLPAGLYLLVEKVILHRNTPVIGARFVMNSFLGYVVNKADWYKRLGVPSLGLGSC